MDLQQAPYHVEDPRRNFRVRKGLWPDCPDCQGLRYGKDGKHHPMFLAEGEVLKKTEVPFPCDTCHSRNLRVGIDVPKHYWDEAPRVPYGTWPDCPDCGGVGGEWSFSYDGHRSDRDKFWHCRTCQARTAEYLRHNPTELDNLLGRQLEQVEPLRSRRNSLLKELRDIDSSLTELNQEHTDALDEQAAALRQKLFSEQPEQHAEEVRS